MNGAPSHVDTFDPKPALLDREGQKPPEDIAGKNRAAGLMPSPFKFAAHGESGVVMSELFPNLARQADDLCVIRSLHGDSVNHPQSVYQMNTGSILMGHPSFGSWLAYGLGSENEDMPAFVVLPDPGGGLKGGPAAWGSGFLPSQYQGVKFRNQGDAVLDISDPLGVSRDVRRVMLDSLSEMNQLKHESVGDPEIRSRIAQYELAYRMQTEVPEVLDLKGESQHTLQLYGIGDPKTDAFGRKCLLARRLIEKGVRFVQAYAGNWDSHDYIERAHGSLIRSVDRPIAALIKDLKQRDLLKDTLIVFCGEFGRTPDNGLRGGGKSYGRDHNAEAMAMWFAGGGVNAGHTVGATDDVGLKAVDCVHHIRDVHVTLLHLLGLDDNKLTYYHAGRFKQLSQFGGDVISELIG